MAKKEVKILVSYHKPTKLFKNDVLTPIHLGRKLSSEISKDGSLNNDNLNWMAKNMIGDDTGDNISDLNRYFCEMTATYWAWKNYELLGNPDYVGFCHYRRFLLFNHNFCRDLSDAFIPEGEEINDYDIVCAFPIPHDKNVYDQFDELGSDPWRLRKEVFDLVLSLVKERDNYKEALGMYLKSKEHYWYNCFVLKKELFFEFCEFAFPILFEAHKLVDYSHDTVNGKRVLAYISERLFGIYVTKKKLEEKKILYKKIAFIEKVDLDENDTEKQNNFRLKIRYWKCFVLCKIFKNNARLRKKLIKLKMKINNVFLM